MKTVGIYEVYDEGGEVIYFGTKKEAETYYHKCFKRYSEKADKSLWSLPTIDFYHWELSKKQMIKLLNAN